MLTISRRGLLFAAASLLAAPSIVRAGSIMPVYAPRPTWQTQTWEEHVAYWFGEPIIDPAKIEALYSPRIVAIAPSDAASVYRHIEVGVDQDGFYRRVGGTKVRG